MQKLAIVGAGGLGREVAWLVERINKVKSTWELIGFIDDNEKLHGEIIGGYQVLGDVHWAVENKNEVALICAIGSSKVRKKVTEKLLGVQFATLIDPKVELSDRISIGEGSILCAGSIITVDISIGAHVVINLDCTIGHDAVLQSYVTLYPSVNISGNTFLGECVEIGTGSQIIQNIKIGDRTIVGAGAVVIKDLPPDCTSVGIPAKPIKSIEQ